MEEKHFVWDTHMMFLMIKTEIFEAYGRSIISCYNYQIKGRDRIYRGKRERERQLGISPKPDNRTTEWDPLLAELRKKMKLK